MGMGRAAHCTEPIRDLILKLTREGKSQREVAKTKGRTKTFVLNALRPPKAMETIGRPRRTTQRDDLGIKRLSHADPFKSSKDIKFEQRLPVCERTIRRRLQDYHLFGRSPREVPLLTTRHRNNRVTYTKEHLNFVSPENGKNWRNILWSDESKVYLVGSD